MKKRVTKRIKKNDYFSNYSYQRKIKDVIISLSSVELQRLTHTRTA
jgi:hypothetical protein